MIRRLGVPLHEGGVSSTTPLPPTSAWAVGEGRNKVLGAVRWVWGTGGTEFRRVWVWARKGEVGARTRGPEWPC